MNSHGELVEFPGPQPRCVLIVGLPNDGNGIVGHGTVARGMKPNDSCKYTHWFNCLYDYDDSNSPSEMEEIVSLVTCYETVNL